MCFSSLLKREVGRDFIEFPFNVIPDFNTEGRGDKEDFVGFECWGLKFICDWVLGIGRSSLAKQDIA